MKFEIAAAATAGARPYQEDSWRIVLLDAGDGTAIPTERTPHLCDRALVLVADGVGGHGGGDVASRVVADGFVARYHADPDPEPRLRQALSEAGRALLDAKGTGTGLNGNAATTIIAGEISPDGLSFLSVGDSLLFRIRDDELHRINQVHEVAVRLDVDAILANTPAAWDMAFQHPYRSAIDAAVDGTEPRHVQIASRDLRTGDILIFASDGIESISAELLRAVVPVLARRDGGAAAVAGGLIDYIEAFSEHGGKGGERQDNATVIVVRVIDEAAAALPAPGQGETAITALEAAPPESAVPGMGPGMGAGKAAGKSNLLIAATAIVFAILGLGWLFVSIASDFAGTPAADAPAAVTEDPAATDSSLVHSPAPQRDVEINPGRSQALTSGGTRNSAPGGAPDDPPVGEGTVTDDAASDDLELKRDVGGPLTDAIELKPPRPQAR